MANTSWFSVAGLMLTPVLGRLLNYNDILIAIVAGISSSALTLTFLMAERSGNEDSLA